MCAFKYKTVSNDTMWFFNTFKDQLWSSLELLKKLSGLLIIIWLFLAQI